MYLFPEYFETNLSKTLWGKNEVNCAKTYLPSFIVNKIKFTNLTGSNRHRLNSARRDCNYNDFKELFYLLVDTSENKYIYEIICFMKYNENIFSKFSKSNKQSVQPNIECLTAKYFWQPRKKKFICKSMNILYFKLLLISWCIMHKYNVIISWSVNSGSSLLLNRS